MGVDVQSLGCLSAGKRELPSFQQQEVRSAPAMGRPTTIRQKHGEAECGAKSDGWTTHVSSGDEFERRWEAMRAVFLKYKESHGNCDVPTGWPPNPNLAAWVHTRKCNTKGTLLPNRKKRLEALGFRFGCHENGKRGQGNVPTGPPENNWTDCEQHAACRGKAFLSSPGLGGKSVRND